MSVKSEEAVVTPPNVDEVRSNHEGVEDLLSGELESGLEEFSEEETSEEVGSGVTEEEEEEEETSSESSEDEDADGDGEGEDEEAEDEEAEVDEAELLRQQIAQLSQVLVSHGIDPSKVMPTEKPEEGEKKEETAPEVSAAQQLLDGNLNVDVKMPPIEISKEEFDEIFESPEKLVDLLNRVRESAVEQVLKSVPSLASNIVNQQMVLKGMVQDFYEANQDLRNVKPFVAVVANEIAARHPDWGVERVFQETAIETRKRLGLKAQALKGEQQQTVGSKRPALPKAKGTTPTRKAQPKLSKLEQELRDLMDV